MDEVNSIQRVILVVDASVHMHAAILARVALDGRVRVYNLQFVLICSHAEVVARHDRDLREQGPARLPALRAAADVAMGALTLDRYGNLVVGTFAIQRAAGEVWRRGSDATIDRCMDGKCLSHCQFPPVIESS